MKGTMKLEIADFISQDIDQFDWLILLFRVNSWATAKESQYFRLFAKLET